MRTLISTFIILAISAIVSAQSSDLPSILIPSDQAKQEASRLDVNAARMLPRLLFEDDRKVRTDSDSKLGIWGNGAFYSFSTKTHSWGNIPELMFSADGFTVVSRFGLMSDLGEFPLGKVTAESQIPALKVLTSYRPPTPDEREQEAKMQADQIRAGIRVIQDLKAVAGHTYLLRAVSPEKADILVAFTVLRIEKDGPLEMIWKILYQNVSPSKLYLSDVDLRLAIQRIINDNNIFKSVTFEILDNRISLTGHTTRREFEIFMKAVDAIRTRGIVNKLDEDK